MGQGSGGDKRAGLPRNRKKFGGAVKVLIILTVVSGYKHMSKFIKLCTLNMYSSWHVSHTTLKLLNKKIAEYYIEVQ